MNTGTAACAEAAALQARRAKVAPLLATGRSIRAISAETGIPLGAVHRAKRQIEKAIAERRDSRLPCRLSRHQAL